MAVYTQQTRVEYEGPAPAFQPFAVPFPFDAPGDLVVTKVVGETETTLVRGTHFDVAGGRPASGTVTLRAPLLAGETLRIQRILPITQLVNLVTQGPYDPRVIEQALDRLTMICQQLAGCEGCSGGEGGCACPEADPGTPDTVEPDPEDPDDPDKVTIIPGDGGDGFPGLITVHVLRLILGHLQWGSVRHQIADVQGLTTALATKLTQADLQPVIDTVAQVEVDLGDKAPVGHTHAFADLEGKPTTLAEAGITDGVTSGDLAAAVNGLAPLSSPEFTGTPKLDGYPLLSTYSSLDWSRVVNRPDSAEGYGILDVYTKAQVDARIPPNAVLAPRVEDLEDRVGMLERQGWVPICHHERVVEANGAGYLPDSIQLYDKETSASPMWQFVVDLRGVAALRVKMQVPHGHALLGSNKTLDLGLVVRLPGEPDFIRPDALRYYGESGDPDNDIAWEYDPDGSSSGDGFPSAGGQRLYVGRPFALPATHRADKAFVALSELLIGADWDSIPVFDIHRVVIEALYLRDSGGMTESLVPA